MTKGGGTVIPTKAQARVLEQLENGPRKWHELVGAPGTFEALERRTWVTVILPTNGQRLVILTYEITLAGQEALARYRARMDGRPRSECRRAITEDSPIPEADGNDSTPVLHLYGQEAYHDDAYMVGTEEGLRALLQGLQQALVSGQGKAEVLVNDGEYYDLHIIRVDGDWQGEAVSRLRKPYTWEGAQDGRPGAVHPSTLVKETPPYA